MNQLGVHVHFWIYELLTVSDNIKYINQICNKDMIGQNVDIWGYKGYWNILFLSQCNCKDHRILNFGVGKVVIDEYMYLQTLNPNIFNHIKKHSYLYNLTKMFNNKDKTLCYKTLTNLNIITALLSN
jgi:hypothetical protein